MRRKFAENKLSRLKVFAGVLISFFIVCVFLEFGSHSTIPDSKTNVSLLSEIGNQKVFAGEKDSKEALSIIELPNDTLKVLDTTAAPGDTFWVTVSLTNTIPVAAVNFLLKIDSLSLISPVYKVLEIWDTSVCYPPPCTTLSIDGYQTNRTYHDPDSTWYMFWGGSTNNNHLDTLRFGFLANIYLYSDPYICLPAGGYGPIIRFKFVVDSNATPGHTTKINFIEWDPSIPPSGGYATMINDTIGINDYRPIVTSGLFTVAGGGTPGDHCPVIAALPDSFQVNEGQKLEFSVTATDVDTDHIELSLSSFSPPPPVASIYHFETKTGVNSVTQTFDYTPDFSEVTGGSIVRYVTFKVKDSPGCEKTKTVAIRIINTVQDMLIAGSNEGGVPGSTGILVPFWLSNSVDIYGFQYTFRWDYTKLDVDSIVGTDAISGFSMYTNLGDSAGKATVLVFGLASQTIPAGLDTVVYVSFSVHSDAPTVEVPITLQNAREAINPGSASKSLVMVNGKLTIDMFGDVNLDRMVDVGDIVTLVAYILSEITFTPRESSAADINRDVTINVGDLVAMIDIILGRWMGPSPPIYTGPMAKVSLDCQDLLPGSSGDVKVMADLQVPVAGAQLRIDYDPNKVSFHKPQLSDRSGHFIVQYRDNGKGELNLVLYNLSNEPISAGVGNILSLPVTVSPGAGDELNIELKQVVLSDEKAVLIPVEGQSPSVPSAFELSQNYPNPFNPTTNIKFTLPSSKDGKAALPTTLKIYNVLGEVVRILVDEPMTPGVYNKTWDGKDKQGNQVASGIYFYKLHAGDFQDTKKMVLMK